MQRLQHLRDAHNRDWWEVRAGKFIHTDDTLDGATRYYVRREGNTGRTKENLENEVGPMSEITDPIYLRDFKQDGRSNMAIEVQPGWILFGADRADAERIAVEHIAHYGRRQDGFGIEVDDAFLFEWELVAVVVKERNPEPVPAPVPVENLALMLAPLTLTKWIDRDKDVWWEVAPGRVLMASNSLTATEIFAKGGIATTRTIADAKLEFGLIAQPEEPPKEQAKDNPEPRQFKDRSGDTWWLLYTEDGEPAFICQQTFEQALDDLEADDYDEPEGPFEEWAPFHEILADGTKRGPYNSWAEAEAGIIKEIEGADTGEAGAVLTVEGTPDRSPNRPRIMNRRKDNRNQFWFEVLPNRWVASSDAGGTAEGAWQSLVDHEFSSGWGIGLDMLNRYFGQSTDAGLVVLEPEKASPVNLRQRVDRSGARCSCIPLDDEAEELQKRMLVDRNTYCVDCGKLRP